MARVTIVERLLQHLDDNASAFWRLWAQRGETPGVAVKELEDVLDTANDDLEDDYLDIGGLIINVVNDLDSTERFELGSGILRRKDKYRDKY